MKKTVPGTTAKNVDEYLDALPLAIQTTLQALRKTIKAAAPEAEEIISYHIPTYKYKGALVHFAAFKNHCSFFVVNKNILQTFAEELKAFKTSGTTIHFLPGNPIPATLVKKMVKIRIKENEGLNAFKKTPGNGKKQ